MEKLAGFSADEVIRKLRQAGFVFDRQTKGSHEIWWNHQTRLRTSMSHYCDNSPEEIAEAILRQAGLNVEELLGL